VNTIPSAHVAAALGAGLAMASWRPFAGATVIVFAILIAVAAALGRYHYAVDCLLGAVVALLIWLAM
jgi:membrane-associated phospholipid phosphatase